MSGRARLRPSEREARLCILAGRQRGLVTRGQAEELGVTERMRRTRLKSGAWVRVLPCVYRLAAVPRSAEQTLLAVCLWGGAQTVISHSSAAALWGLEGFDFERDPFPHLTSSKDLRRARAGSAPVRAGRGVAAPEVGRRDRRWRPTGELDLTTLRAKRSPQPVDRRRRLGVPVTSVARTLLDLCASVPGRAEGALHDALRRRLVSVAELEQLCQREAHQRTSGLRLLRRLVKRLLGLGGPTESWLETKTARVLARGGFHPVRQHRLLLEGNRYRLDFAFVKQKVVVEAQGYRYHHTVIDWSRDQTRQSVLTAAGWRVLLTTAHELKHHPHRLLGRLERLLEESDEQS